MQHSKLVFKPQGTVKYELNVSHFWLSTTGENIREQYGTKTNKNILDESVG